MTQAVGPLPSSAVTVRLIACPAVALPARSVVTANWVTLPEVLLTAWTALLRDGGAEPLDDEPEEPLEPELEPPELPEPPLPTVTLVEALLGPPLPVSAAERLALPLSLKLMLYLDPPMMVAII